MYTIKPPVRVYDFSSVADQDGHVCECDDIEIARAVAAALVFAAVHPDFNQEEEEKKL